jgi:hypothetical protein
VKRKIVTVDILALALAKRPLALAKVIALVLKRST